MKRTGGLWNKIVEPDNLRLAFWKAQRGKQTKPEVIRYRAQLEANLASLRDELLTGRFPVGNYHYFKIYDPKERTICAASFPERVFHHALMNICHEVFERFQIDDSYATRPGKGTYAALRRAEYFHRRHTWFLKMDIRKYFDSIDHTRLGELLRRKFKDQKLLDCFDQIVASYQSGPDRGLPIGNLTSQYFANFYLAFADHFVQENLRHSTFVRYMDDMVLWCASQKRLKEIRGRLTEFLADQLGLDLKIALLNRTRHGADFLGYRLFEKTTHLNRRSRNRFRRRLATYEGAYQEGVWSDSEYQAHLLPLLAFTEQCDAMPFRRKVLQNIST